MGIEIQPHGEGLLQKGSEIMVVAVVVVVDGYNYVLYIYSTPPRSLLYRLSVRRQCKRQKVWCRNLG